jgi:hypothetical protein
MSKRLPIRPRLLLLTFGLAAVLAGACDNTAGQMSANLDNRPVGMSGSAPTADEKNAKKPIDLTGCLQKADGSYVLTQISTPNANAAPTSKKGDGSVVEREQMHAAQHAYRLSADKADDLEKLVGKQVKVSGTVMERSELTGRDDRKGNDLSVGTSGAQDRNHERDRDRAKIDASDLARVDVTSIQQTAEGCGKRR